MTNEMQPTICPGVETTHLLPLVLKDALPRPPLPPAAKSALLPEKCQIWNVKLSVTAEGVLL